MPVEDWVSCSNVPSSSFMISPFVGETFRKVIRREKRKQRDNLIVLKLFLMNYFVCIVDV